MKAKLENKGNKKNKRISDETRKYRKYARPKELLAGKWSITGMEMWDKEYYDEYVKAHVTINRDGGGEFRFCLVEANMDGEFNNTPEGAVFDFTFAGNDEMDETFGDGWLRTIDGKTAEGVIRFHQGDKSGFNAKKIIVKGKPAAKSGKRK